MTVLNCHATTMIFRYKKNLVSPIKDMELMTSLLNTIWTKFTQLISFSNFFKRNLKQLEFIISVQRASYILYHLVTYSSNFFAYNNYGTAQEDF